VLALVASLSGLLAAPAGAETLTLTGTVAPPPGYTKAVSGTVRIALDYDRGRLVDEQSVQLDGTRDTFSFSGLRAGAKYLVLLEPDAPLLGGWYRSGGGALVDTYTSATRVSPGHPLVLRPRLSATMSGKVELDGADADADVSVAVRERTRTGEVDEDTRWVDPAADGTFRVEGLDPDLGYTVQVAEDGVVEQYLGEDGEPTTRRSAAAEIRPRDGVTLRYAPRTVTGRVVLPDGFTTKELRVRWKDEQGVSRIERVASDGSFVLSGLTPGEPVKIGVLSQAWEWSGGWYVRDDRLVTRHEELGVDVAPGTSGVVLRLPEVRRIEGQIDTSRLPGDGAVSFQAILYRREVSVLEWGAAIDQVDVGADGRFSLRTDDQSSGYHLSVIDRSWPRRAAGGFLTSTGRFGEREDAMTIAPGTTGLRISARPLGERLSVDLTFPPGVPRPSTPVTVTAYDESGARVAGAGSSLAPAVLELDPQESYALRISGSGLATVWYAGDGVPGVGLRSDAVLVSPGGTVTVGAVAAGTAEGVGALAIEGPGREVPKNERVVDVVDADTGETVERVTGGDVRATVDGLPPGDYLVAVNRVDGPSPFAAGFAGTTEPWVPDRSDAARITVRAGEPAVAVGVGASQCATYSGVIDQDLDGEDATVRLWGDDRPERSWSGTRGEDAFAVTGLADGTYHVALRVGRGPEQRFDDVVVSGCADVGGARLGTDPRVRAEVAPTVTGGTRVGDVLTVDAGTWTPQPSGVAFQWYSGPEPVAGATSSTYRVRPSDLGRSVSVRVTASAPGLRATTTTVTTTTAVTRAPLGDATVTLPTTTRVGVTARATLKGWSGAGVTWQWLRDGLAIVGATSATYTPKAADEGRALSAVAYGTRAGYVPASAVSATSAPRPAFESTAAPTVSGTAAVGRKVSTTWGSWSLKPDKVTYQWLRNGVAISGATGSSYTPVAADKGKKLKVRLTAQRSGQPKRTVSSAARTVAAGTITSTRAPSVSGTVRVGQTVKTTGGTWNPKGVKLQYQWLRNGSPISGATRSYYKLVAADRGKRIQVRVKAQLSGYTARTVTSATTSTVR